MKQLLEPTTNPTQGEAGSKPKVLELRDVSFTGQSENSVGLSRVNLAVHEGELVMVHLAGRLHTRDLASMLQGLRQPTSGSVLFESQDWLGGDFDRHFTMRGRIGRVFEGQAWIENLNVAENVTLARRHHRIAIDSINRDVKHWVKRLNITDLSRKRPAFLEPSLLQVHQWIRAFLVRPALLILERPMRSVPATWLPRLVGALDELRRQGTAVLWLTSHDAIGAEHFSLPPIHLRLENNQLLPMDGDSEE